MLNVQDVMVGSGLRHAPGRGAVPSASRVPLQPGRCGNHCLLRMCGGPAAAAQLARRPFLGHLFHQLDDRAAQLAVVDC